MITSDFEYKRINKQNIKHIAKLVQGVKAGNDNDFVELYKCMYQKIYYFAFSILKEKYLAEDVVQEVFIIVFKNISTLKNDDYFIAWANKITYNKSLEALNKNREIPMDEEDLISFRGNQGSDEILTNLLRVEQQDTIAKRIMKLTPELKTVIYLRYYNDYSLNDIAETMDCPVGTIKSRLNTAKKLLRKGISMEKDLFQWLLFGGTVIFTSWLKSEEAFAMDATAKHVGMGVDLLKARLNIDAAVVCDSAQNSAGLISSSSHVNLAAVLGALGVAACVAGCVAALQLPPHIKICSDADQYVNHPLSVSIEFSGFVNKDSIVVWNKYKKENVPTKECDGFYEAVIRENGTYGVTVENGKGEKTETFFEVSKIDMKAPEIDLITYDEDEDNIHVRIGQELAGVNWGKSFGEDENGTILRPITKSENECIFSGEQMPLTVYIYDFAGNYSSYEIDFKKDEHNE